mgnify:FL=1
MIVKQLAGTPSSNQPVENAEFDQPAGVITSSDNDAAPVSVMPPVKPIVASPVDL